MSCGEGGQFQCPECDREHVFATEERHMLNMQDVVLHCACGAVLAMQIEQQDQAGYYIQVTILATAAVARAMFGAAYKPGPGNQPRCN